MSLLRLPTALIPALLVVLTGPAASAAPSSAAWRWPVGSPVVVLRGFEPPPGPYAAGHRGVDLAAAEGTTVRAAGSGTVVVAGPVAGRPVVVVAHGAVRTTDELRTTYEPVQPGVVVGERVATGDPLGTVATEASHCSPGCLHWGLRRGEVYLDPTGLLDHEVRLLPVGPPQRARHAPVLQPPPTRRTTVAEPTREPEPSTARPSRIVAGAATAIALSAALLGLRRKRGRPTTSADQPSRTITS